MSWVWCLAALIVVCAQVGCGGYRFAGVGARALPSEYRSVAVPGFENMSAESGLGSACARVLQARLAVGGVVLAADPTEADLVVSGVIEGVETEPVAFDAPEGVMTEQVTVEASVSLTLVARVLDAEVWRAEGRRGARLYESSGDPVQTHAARREAVDAACAEAALDAADALVDHLEATPEAAEMFDAPPAILDDGESQEAAGEVEEATPSVVGGAPVEERPVDLTEPTQRDGASDEGSEEDDVDEGDDIDDDDIDDDDIDDGDDEDNGERR